MKGKIILLVTAIVVIALTIGLYYLAVTEWTPMIQLSLAIVCLAEFAIIGTMGLLPVLNFKNGSTGIMVNIYAAIMILWSLIGCNFEGKTYPFGLLLISVVMLVLIGLSVVGSHESDRLNKEVEETISKKHTFTAAPPRVIKNSQSGTKTSEPENLSSMWLTIQSTVDDYDTQKRLRILVERIKTLPATQFPNPIIEASMAQITAMCRALSKTEDTSRMLERINNKAKELTNYIKSL